MEPVPDGSTFALDDGASRAVVAPGAGAALVSWHLRAGNASVPLLRSGPRYPDPADPFALGCNVLLPWSNRISGGGFALDGAFHALAPNLPDEPCPIHGNAFQLPWTVASRDDRSAVLTLASDGPGPFRYGARIGYRLHGGALEVSLRVTNRAPMRLPYGCGLHPWFPRTPGLVLRLDADEVRLEDARYLPAGAAALADVPAWDFREGACLPPDWINNAFTGWSGTASLEWPLHELAGFEGDAPAGAAGAPADPRRVRLRLHAGPGLDVCVVHSPGAGARFVCVEPVSHPVDSHHDAERAFEGLVPLACGETLETRCRFEAGLVR